MFYIHTRDIQESSCFILLLSLFIALLFFLACCGWSLDLSRWSLNVCDQTIKVVLRTITVMSPARGVYKLCEEHGVVPELKQLIRS